MTRTTTFKPKKILRASKLETSLSEVLSLSYARQDDLRESVVYTQFKSGAMSDGEAIAAAINYLWTNNGDVGGIVTLPPGPPIAITSPIEARPGVTVRGPRKLTVPSWTHGVSIGVFDVNGHHDFALEHLVIETSDRAPPVYVVGDTLRFRAHDVRLINSRGFFLHRAQRARLTDIMISGGRFGLATGENSGALVDDVMVSNFQCYDCTGEGVDINFNTTNFSMVNFAIVGCGQTDLQEAVDIGGGTCRRIVFAHGVVDCGGRDMAGIKAKLGVKDLLLFDVDVVNGAVAGVNSYGINLEETYDARIVNCGVDASFSRGLFLEPDARRAVIDMRRCDSPIFVNGGEDHDIRFVHDGGGTTNTNAAIKVDFSAVRVKVGGRIANRPSADAVIITGSALKTRVEDLIVTGGQRGVNIGAGCNDTAVNGLRITGNERFCVTTATNLLRLRIENIEAEDTNTLASEAVVQVNTGCNQAIIRNVVARDTRAGASRTTGRPLNLVGSADKIHYDNIYAENLATGTVGTGASLTNVTAGTALAW